MPGKTPSLAEVINCYVLWCMYVSLCGRLMDLICSLLL